MQHSMSPAKGLSPLTTQQKADSVFSGISTFGRLPYFPCLASDEEKFDIAFIGRQADHDYETRARY